MTKWPVQKQTQNNTQQTERCVGRLALCTHRLLLQNEVCNIKQIIIYYSDDNEYDWNEGHYTVLKLFQIEF